jgi:tetratricopeptide (TPR) repeat protein
LEILVNPILFLAAILLAWIENPVPLAEDDSPPPPVIGIDQVIEAAEKVETPWYRASLLVEIAGDLSEKGDRARAQKLASKGLAIVRAQIDTIGDERAGYLWVRLALLQNKMSDRDAARRSLERAVEIARKTKEKNRRIDLLQFTAHTFAEIGDFESAQTKTEILTFEGKHIFALEDIAVAQARAGNIAGARRTAAKIHLVAVRDKRRSNSDKPGNDQTPVEYLIAAHELTRAEVLAEIALVQARSGSALKDEARKTIDEVLAIVEGHELLRPDLAPLPLATIAVAQASLRQAAQSRATFERALRITRRLDPFPGSEILARIAEAHWKAGQTTEARSMLREAFERFKPHASGFPQVYDLITQTEVKIGDLDGALQTARACRNAQGEITLRPDVLREVVRAQSALSSPSAAVAEWYRITRSPVYRAYALLGAAEAVAPGNDSR